jgi:hypothetical protein
MKKVSASLLCATLFTMAANASENTPLTTADQCMIESYQSVIAAKAGTAETVDVEIDPMQKACEDKTGTAVQHPDLLKKGPSDFRAGGTQFIFK